MADRGAVWTGAIPGGNVLFAGDNVHNFKAGAAITRGMVVAIHGTGVDFTVWPCILGTTLVPLGIATETVASGAMCAVAGLGCIAYCQQETNAVDMDAGTQLVITDSAGQVGALAAGAPEKFLVGILLETSDASALSYERCLVLCGLPTQIHA